MNPIAFSLGLVRIHWYGILMVVAIGISYWLIRRNVRIYGMDSDKVEGILLKILIVIFIGARLAYVVSKWDFYQANFWEIIRIDHGGLGSHGAIFAALICGYYWTKKAGISY